MPNDPLAAAESGRARESPADPMLRHSRSALPARAELLATLLAASPLPAHAANAASGPWLAYLVFIAVAVVVVAMLLREALTKPADEPSEAPRATDGAPARGSRRGHARRGSAQRRLSSPMR